MSCIYILQWPEGQDQDGDIIWNFISEDHMMAFTDYDRAEQMAVAIEELPNKTIVHKRGGSTELEELHVAMSENGTPLWRILGMQLWEGK
jgi:hypothetical protein